MLKSQRRLRNEAHNAFTEKVSKSALSANDDKIIQSNNLFLWLWLRRYL